jgi:phosphoglycerate-specific signal transduction histidine kinase
MFRVVLSIVLLVILVVLIVLNLGYTTSFNVFGRKFEEIPVTAVALVSFAVGVIYSFAYYLGSYLARISKTRFRKRGEQVKVREQELKEKERELDEKVEDFQETKGQLQTTSGDSAGDSEGGFPQTQVQEDKTGRRRRRKK